MVRQRYSILMLLVPFALFFVSFTIPLIWAMVASLYNTKGAFVGIGNYVKVFKDASFWSSISFTFIYAAATTGLMVVVGYFLALAINQLGRGGGVAKAVMLIPWAISLTAWGLMMQIVTSQDFGILNDLLIRLHLLRQRISWLGVDSYARPMVIASRVVKEVWFATLLFLVGRQVLPIELYEEAKVSGASPWQALWRVTTPLMMTNALYTLTITLIFSLQEFDMIYALTRGGPGFSTETAALSIYRWGILFGKYELGTAYTTIWSLFVSLLVVVLLGRVLIRNLDSTSTRSVR
ncbi:MAG TPA: sugar ABC transporter permease [Spirochaetia bacterium]|nr:sugar ABC transporter permease [Spirochaetia bacterium]